MTIKQIRNAAAMILTLLLAAAPLESAAPKKSNPPRRKIVITGKKKPPVARKPVAVRARAVAPVPVGATFELRLDSLVNGPTAQSAESSIQVVEVETGRVVAERNPHLPLAPASNLKLFTTGAALDLLTPEFQFKTSVFMRGKVDSTGTLQGDVKIVGRGDPTIGGRFHDGHAAAVLEEWARELQRGGVKSISGDLIFEYGYFDAEYIHPTWPVDQLVNWYEAPIAALSMQEGCVMIRVLPSAPGKPAIVEMEPPNQYVRIANSCVTGGGGRGVFITRLSGTNEIVVRGGVPTKSGPTEVFVTILNPLHYFASVTKTAMDRSGIRLLGQVRLVPADVRPDWRTVAEHKTPLSIVVFVINKKSQNHYAEQLLKVLGAELKKDGSWRGGSAVVTEWLTQKVGVSPAEFRQIDGSGMSRFSRTSSNSFIKLLAYMWKTPWRRDFLSSMPYSGERDSRLKRRLNQEPYARQVYAKTGYISGVIGLSGYVHAKSGKVYAFSFLFNRYRTGVWGVYQLQDEMLKEIIRSG